MRVLDRKDYRLLTRDCIDKVDNRLSNRLTDCRTLAPFMKTLKFAVARRFRESVKKSKRVRGATQGTRQRQQSGHQIAEASKWPVKINGARDRSGYYCTAERGDGAEFCKQPTLSDSGFTSQNN